MKQKESIADQLRALALAIGVHVLCVGLLFVGLAWTHAARPLNVEGTVIEASLVTAPPSYVPPPRVKVAVEHDKPEVPKPPRIEPPKPDKVVVDRPTPPAPPPGDANVNQDKVDRQALEASQTALREQEEKRKKEQELLEAEQRTKMDRERDQQLADIKKKREQAAEKLQREKLLLAELNDREKQPPTPPRPEPPRSDPATRLGNNGDKDDLSGRYAIAIKNAVEQNWLRPDNLESITCDVRVVQIPGGQVLSATVVQPCNADEIGTRSLEAAVLRAQPLPYNGYESVFNRQILFTFCYPKELCKS